MSTRCKKNIFLHGLLQENVYMEQLLGYIDTSHSNYVRHLKKTIYDLKQALRVWLHRFSNFLIKIDFNCSKVDYNLFVHSMANGIICLHLYVDDIVITRSLVSIIDTFIHKLCKNFLLRVLAFKIIF